MAEGNSNEGRARVGTIEGAFYALCSVAVWVIFNAFVFVCSYVVVSETKGEIPWKGWAFVAAVALIPLVPLCILASKRLRSGSFVPTTRFSRQVFLVQIIGVGFLAVAILVPPTLLWSYTHPSVDLVVSNQSDLRFDIRIYGYSGNCVGNGAVEPRAERELTIEFPSGFFESCDGASAERLELRNARGTWECAWPLRAEHKPLTLLNDGPKCEVIDSYQYPVFDPSPPFAEP